MTYFEQEFLISILIVIILCVNCQKLENLQFGKILEGRTYVRTFHESALDCMINCAIRLKCESINYHALTRACQLNYEKGDSSVLTSALGWLYSDDFRNILPDGITNQCQQREAYNIETQSCETRECEETQDFQAVHSHGNLVNTGAKVLLSCPNGEYPMTPSVLTTWPVQSVCKNDGDWSVPGMECGPLQNTCPAFLGYNFDNSWSGLQWIHDIRLITECNVTVNFSASSVHRSFFDLHGPHMARLDSTGWVADQTDTLPYIQVTFDKIINTTGLTTASRTDYPEFVMSYNVTYGTTEAECGNGPTEKATDENNMITFEGNSDNITQKVNHFFSPIQLLCLRLYPVTYNLIYYPGTRLDVLASVQLPFWAIDDLGLSPTGNV